MISNFVRGALLPLVFGMLVGSTLTAQAQEHAVILGSDEAPVKLDLYYSYACPHCLGLLSDTSEAVNDAVTANRLQIRYHEMPGGHAGSANMSEATWGRADDRSYFLTSVMQCFAQEGSVDAFQRAQTALPGLLRDAVGSGRSLPPEGAPEEYTDWQYWIWADEEESPYIWLAQPLVNVAQVDIRQCNTDTFIDLINARKRGMNELRTQSVPELLVNGQRVPPGETHIERLEAILANTDTIATIREATFDIGALRVTEPEILRGAVMLRDPDDLYELRLSHEGERYALFFGPTRTAVRHYGTYPAEYPKSPLLNFLFFGTDAAHIAEVQNTSMLWEQIIQLKDDVGNVLIVFLRQGEVMSLAYEGAGEDGFTFAMDAE